MKMTYEPLVLQRIFTALVHEFGFPLGARDLVDTLSALQMGFGLGSRAELLWLCQSLWARSVEEQRIIALVFERIPPLTEEQVRALEQRYNPDHEKPAPDTELPKGGRTSGDSPPFTPPPPVPDDSWQSPGVEFSGRTKGEGVRLPRANIKPSSDEHFVFTARPLFMLRNLIMIWRRFRQPIRYGVPVEVDIDATIEERCRSGWIPAPVMIPARRNRARLLVLVDVSESMIPWRGLNPLLAESLRASDLRSAEVFYFYRIPDESLYCDEEQTQPVALKNVLKQATGSALLIISDAGAGKREDSRKRAREWQQFFKETQPYVWPTVWVNPLPRHRWAGTTAQRIITQTSQVAMFELSEDGLVDAVDVLRGVHSADNGRG